MAHPATKTKAIIKSAYRTTKDGADVARFTAYSYDIEKRVEPVLVLGGDGRMHAVPVFWDEYMPLKNEKDFFIRPTDEAGGRGVLATKNGLCIYS